VSQRGDFAQALMSRSVEYDNHKDGQQWAIRHFNPDGSGQYEDVPIEVSKPRDATAQEAQLYGQSRITGGWKVTLGGSVALLESGWGELGDITEDMVIVAGSAMDLTRPLPGVVDAKRYDIVHVHRVVNFGVVQQYYLFLQPASGGPTSG